MLELKILLVDFKLKKINKSCLFDVEKILQALEDITSKPKVEKYF